MNKLVTFRHLVVAGILALLAASCSDVTDDGTLPDGKYPMTFTASVDGLIVTRATTDNSWTGEEVVAIQIGSEVKQYVAAAGGSLTVASGSTPFYWQNTSDIAVNAWYPYNTTKPAAEALTVKANQSEDDNYQSSDYLEAVDAMVTFNNPAALTFKHRTAKVVVKLTAGEGITDLTDAAVTFVNQIGVEDNGAEVISKTETANGESSYTALVIPQQMKGKQFIKVTIGAGGAARDYYYTPTNSTDANLEAGKQYTYTITVKKTGLEVTVTGNGTVWTDTPITTNPDAAITFHITAPTSGVTIAAASGGTLTDNSNGSYTLSGGNAVSITATSIYIKSIKGLYEVAGDGTTYTLKSDLLIAGYTLADARVGDFYCKSSDGSTGYLIPCDASLTEAQQTACIGIVYSTDAERIGKEATEVLKKKGVSTPHGLVMALTDASSGCSWGNNGEDENSGGNDGEPFKSNIDHLYKQYADVDGYAETHWIINTYGSNAATLLNTYTAFYFANRYGTTDGGTHQYAVPANVTTGWFIPSMGQWWDILSNLGGVNLDEYKNDIFANGVVDIPGATTTMDNINKYLQKIKGAKLFSTPDVNFWSSSEYNGTYACNMYSSNGLLCLHSRTKDFDQTYVRCIFAF